MTQECYYVLLAIIVVLWVKSDLTTCRRQECYVRRKPPLVPPGTVSVVVVVVVTLPGVRAQWFSWRPVYTFIAGENAQPEEPLFDAQYCVESRVSGLRTRRDCHRRGHGRRKQHGYGVLHRPVSAAGRHFGRDRQ